MPKHIILTDTGLDAADVIFVTRGALPQTIGGLAAGDYTLRNTSAAVSGVVTAPAVAAAVTDTFTAADGTALSGRIVEAGGVSWSATAAPVISGGKVVLPNPANQATFPLANVGGGLWIEADITRESSSTNASCGLLLGADATNTAIRAQINWQVTSGSWAIYNGTASVASLVEAWAIGVTRRVRLELADGVATAYVDGVQVLTGTGVAATGGRAGLRGAGGNAGTGFSYDNIAAGYLSGG